MKTHKSKQAASKAAYKELRESNPEASNDELRELFTIEDHNDGGHFWRRVQTNNEPEMLPIEAEVVEIVDDILFDTDVEEIDNVTSIIVDESVNNVPESVLANINESLARINNAAPNVDQKAIAENTTSDGVLRKSFIGSPCQFVHEAAARMNAEGATRGQVVKHCIAHGVATHTAKTQYQKWFTAHKNDLARQQQTA